MVMGKTLSSVNKEDTQSGDGKDIVVSEQGGYSGWGWERHCC